MLLVVRLRMDRRNTPKVIITKEIVLCNVVAKDLIVFHRKNRSQIIYRILALEVPASREKSHIMYVTLLVEPPLHLNAMQFTFLQVYAFKLLSLFTYIFFTSFCRKTLLSNTKTVLFILFIKQHMNMMNIYLLFGKRLHNIY